MVRKVSCAADSTARLWDVATGNCIRLYRSPREAFMLIGAFSPNGSEVVTGDLNGVARLWRPQWSSEAIVRCETARPSAIRLVHACGDRMVFNLPTRVDFSTDAKLCIYSLDGRMIHAVSLARPIGADELVAVSFPRRLEAGTFIYRVYQRGNPGAMAAGIFFVVK